MGGFADDEIPLLVMLFYLFHGAEPVASRHRFWPYVRNQRERQRQVGSLAGAAHLLNDNTGVLN